MTEKSLVYVIEHPQFFYKIGTSKDPESRCKSLQIGSPYELAVRTSIVSVDSDECRHTLESQLHSYYSPCQERGEWFGLPAAEVAALERLDEINPKHVESVMYDLYGSVAKKDGRCLYDYLRDLWAIECSSSDTQEGDR